MRVENRFPVEIRPGILWGRLAAVEELVPCIPGAALTGVVDERTWRGTVTVKFGPVSLNFGGTVGLVERDDERRRMVLHAKGSDQQGRGAANADITMTVVGDGSESGSDVVLQTDIQITGKAAQLSRGMIPEVARQITAQFAKSLRMRLAAEEGEHAAAADGSPHGEQQMVATAPGPHLGGLRLVIAAIWSPIADGIRRIFRRAR